MTIEQYPRTPRLVNRFALGSDPEFVFTTFKGSYIFAESVGLTTMEGFGCDMAGRQAEIRAYPSRFALEVVASIVDSLRWMAFVHAKKTLDLNWSAISYNGHDGCGGHIHFGRRRPEREKEIKILDGTILSLLNTGILCEETFRERRRLKKYGKWGDVRLKAHGYEYRTPPTALANPWLCYFTLVAHKLALYRGVSETWSEEYLSFRELFEHYQNMDDDAAIALKALNLFGLPVDSPADFKPHWGILVDPFLMAEQDFNGVFFPSTIPPEGETCHELFRLLTQGIALPRRLAKPTWEPFWLPRDFYKIDVQTHTLGHLPDVGMDLISRKVIVHLSIGNEFVIYSAVPLPVQEIRKALDVRVSFAHSAGIDITVPQKFNQSLEQCKLLHDVLSNSKLFPVCKAKDFANVDWSRWDSPEVPKAKPSLGRLIARVEGVPEPPLFQRDIVRKKRRVIIRAALPE